MKKTLLLTIIGLLSVNESAQGQINRIENSFALGTSNGYLSSDNFWNNIANPSASSFNRTSSIGFGLVDRFQIKDLRSYYIVADYCTKKGKAAGFMYYSGDQFYNLLSTAISYSLALGAKSYLGMQIQLLKTAIKQENDSKKSTYSLKSSLSNTSKINDYISTANILTTEWSRNGSLIALDLKTGLDFKIGHYTYFFASFYADNHSNKSYALGLAFKHRGFNVCISIDPKALMPCIMLQVDMGAISVNLAFTHHQYIGNSSGFALYNIYAR